MSIRCLCIGAAAFLLWGGGKLRAADTLHQSPTSESKQAADSPHRSPERGSNLRTTGTLPQSPVLFRYTIPAATGGKLRYALGGSLYYGTNASMVTGLDGQPSIRKLSSNQAAAPGSGRMVTGELGVAVGVHRTVDLSVALPLYADIAGWGVTEGTVGDLSLSATYVPPLSLRVFRFGTRLSVITPTGNQEACLLPRHVYYIQRNPATIDDRGVTFARNKFYLHPSVIASLDLQKIISRLPLEMHLNAGGIFSDAKERFAVDGALAFALRPVRPLTFSLEFSSETRPFVPGRSIINGFLADPLRCVPAGAVDLPGGITLRLAGDIGLSSGKGTLRSNWHRGGYVYATKAAPFYGIAFSLVYRGTFMALARGLAAAEDRSAPAWSGMPGDQDRDSIPDSLDNCPGTPEDRDGFSDIDGCPDYDNDSDGVADEIDGCPDNPEDVDRFEDNDGCPDTDNDGDGMPDSTDACPDEKGPENNHGCPETGELAFVRTVLAAVAFEPGASRIVSGSEMLDRIFKAMQKAPASVVEFQVHTDNRGSADSCRVLSQKRADVLKLYLVAKGIRPDRIKAVGLGSEFPIADNSTETGRAKNQRVEVRRIE
ncbi:MAG: OmpA family protein [Chitinispirillaceae bacterium]|nr:OmpA family protein [Chitinispirillaceae bacterium]